MQGILKRACALVPLIGVVGISGLLVALPAQPGRADQGAGKGYLPGLGDLMNASMQVHHLKLWYAGHSDNWALAAYELKEINETVEDIQHITPTWHGIPVGDMVKSIEPDLKALDDAVKAKDPVKFDTAFHQLTGGCNACHAAANQSEIKIVDPPPQGGGPFANQDFKSGSGPE